MAKFKSSPPSNAPSDTDVNTSYQLGVSHCISGDIPAAIQSWKQTLRLDATHAETLYDLGVAYLETGNIPQAINMFSRLVEFHPDHKAGRYNLGNLMFRTGHTEESIAILAPFLNDPAPHHGSLTNLGRALRRAGRLQEADACYRQALTTSPDDPHIHWNRAHILCLMGQWDMGFAEWEYRLAAGIHPPVIPNSPEWMGMQHDDAPQSLLLIGEQGHGDTIQCLRYIPALLSSGCKLTLAIHSALIPFVDTLLPEVKVIEFSNITDSQANNWAPLFSLPHRLKLPAPEQTAAPHLHTVFQKAIRQHYGRPAHHHNGTPRHIGIAWAGNPNHENDSLRSMPGILLEPLIRNFSDIHWHNLQMDAAAQNLKPSTTSGALIPPPHVDNFADTAKIASQMDLIICVDTAIAHIAGTLGIPCWMMLAAEPDWRWGQTGSTTPWYPTTRLFRQNTLGDWSNVIADISAALTHTMTNQGINASSRNKTSI